VKKSEQDRHKCSVTKFINTEYLILCSNSEISALIEEVDILQTVFFQNKSSRRQIDGLWRKIIDENFENS